MKTNEIEKAEKTLEELGNCKKVRWIDVQLTRDADTKCFHDVPLEDAKKMITYCINSEVYMFSVTFYQEEEKNG